MLDRFDLPPAADLSDLTPSPPAVTDQSIVESRARRRAEALGADVRFNVDLLDLEQDDAGVTVEVENRVTGRRQRLRAGHLIAADGNDSVIRGRLGVGTQGPGVLSHQMNIYRAAIPGPIDPRELVVCQIENDLVHAFFGYDSAGVGMPHLHVPSGGRRVHRGLYQRPLLALLVRAAMGVSDAEIELVGRTPWTMAGTTRRPVPRRPGLPGR